MEKTLLVVGATSDMGINLIKAVGHEYSTIYAHYRRENEALMRIKEDFGKKIIPVCADLNIWEDVEGMIEQIKKNESMPDHIVFFAAPPAVNGHFHKMPVSVFDEALNISLRSTVLICRAFIPYMTKKRHGRIVMMLSSVVLNQPDPYCYQYITEKYALLGLMKALSGEYVSKGVTVNGVSPSYTDTNYIKNIPEIIVEKHISQNPMGRLLCIEEIINPIKFLLSDDSCAISGENIAITYGK